jgi:hypothetical protein
MDVQTRRDLAADRAAALARSIDRQPKSARARQRLGLWLVDVGLRLACEQPLLSRA